jgi:hypothetical protein
MSDFELVMEERLSIVVTPVGDRRPGSVNLQAHRAKLETEIQGCFAEVRADQHAAGPGRPGSVTEITLQDISIRYILMLWS